MTRWCWWLLVAGCDGSSPVDTADTVDTDSPEPEVAESAPAFARIPDAQDLDPADDVVEVRFVATTASHDLGRGVVVEGYGYGGASPGPTVRAKVGDEVVVHLDNELDVPTTLHWHGLKVPEAVDGVTWMRDPVAAGASATVRFTVSQAGTFWVHPHIDTARQVDLGLYAAVVVEAPSPPFVDDDVVLVLDRWGEVGDAEQERWSVNGRLQPHWEREASGLVRARLVNASNHGWLVLPDVTVVGLDQGLLAAPQTGVTLSPGDRADVLLDMSGEGALIATPSSAAGEVFGAPAAVLTWAAPERDTPAPSWPSSVRAPTPDPGGTAVRYTLTGSDAGGWEINGETFPDITIEQLTLGSTEVIEVRNASGSRHPFHIHGLTFEVLSVDGVAPEQRLVEDTLDVGIGSVVRLLVVADNPGDWMVHCHLLGHAEQGMMTVLSVR